MGAQEAASAPAPAGGFAGALAGEARDPEVTRALELAECVELPMPDAAFARRATAERGWDGRLALERMTPHVTRKVLVYDFPTLAGYLLGNEALTGSRLSKAAIDSPGFALTCVDMGALVKWVRDSMGDAALADALASLVSPRWCFRDQMSVARVLVRRRYAQFRRALGEVPPDEGEGGSPVAESRAPAAGSDVPAVGAGVPAARPSVLAGQAVAAG